MKQKWKIYFKWLAALCVILIIVTGLLIGVFFYKLSNEPFFDDGPFAGIKRMDCILSNPDNSIELPDGAKLEVYQPEHEQQSPTVRYITANGLVSWCLYADGYEQTQVKSIEFHSVHLSSYNGYLVKGLVDWTYGREKTLWYLNARGELEHYWYSW